ncbi:MAG TPA: hypothetical protein VKX16_09485 [Chloroflexota bacterium]|nr:hypothetical protein [Chloroflexota bacterium]
MTTEYAPGAPTSHDPVFVPAIAGRQNRWRNGLNLLFFLLAMLGGEWLVHQASYIIEYGSRFDAVMAAAPHRYYMATAGVLMAAWALGGLGLGAVVLQLLWWRRRRLWSSLPPELRLCTPAVQGVQARQVALTAAALAAGQILLYVAQENLETAALGQSLPALGVLYGAQHLAVLPLHLSIATASAFLLWTASCLLNRALRAVRFAALLVEIARRRRVAVCPAACAAGYIPNLRFVAGVLGLRSPPPDVATTCCPGG